MFKYNDYIVGIVSILLGLFIVLQSKIIDEQIVMSIDPAGPTALPNLMAYLIIAIGVIHLGGTWYANKALAQKPDKKKIRDLFTEYKAVIYSCLVSVIYATFLDTVGYLILTPLLMAALLWIVQIRKIPQLVKVSVSMTAILYLVFALGLRVRLPLGFLEIFFG
ncbi:MAG: tripartite tricarboxylate transporter TctB family protein [Peptococcaceae bacterium]